MQTVLQSQVQPRLASSKHAALDASRVGCVSLPLRRRFLSGSRLTARRLQQNHHAFVARSHGLNIRAEKVRKIRQFYTLLLLLICSSAGQ
jgi:hypothetical protein